MYIYIHIYLYILYDILYIHIHIYINLYIIYDICNIYIYTYIFIFNCIYTYIKVSYIKGVEDDKSKFPENLLIKII